MYRDLRIGVVIPAYREEQLIGPTLDQVPEWVDHVVVVDDASPDQQNKVIEQRAQKNQRIELISHKKNQGPGAAIISGYRRMLELKADVVLVIGGDNQMDLKESKKFIDPIAEGQADYTKGNRFTADELDRTLALMPKIRIFGNLMLTGLTKVASGNYGIMDVVDGYTAISRRAIERIDWKKAWLGYGYPMDFLIRLNAYGFRIADVPREAIYLPGVRQSQIKGWSYFWRVSPMLIQGWLWRLKYKYILRNLHPLIGPYLIGLLAVPLGCLGSLLLICDKLFFSGENVTAPRSIAVVAVLFLGIQCLLVGMWMDMKESQ